MTTEILCHFDGADGASTFEDSSYDPATVSVSGAVLEADEQKWGTASGDFAGSPSNDYVTFTKSGWNDAFDGDWTVDFWFYLQYFPSSNSILRIPDLLVIELNSTYLRVEKEDEPGSYYANISHSGLISGLTWHHIAVARNSATGNAVVTVDGVAVGYLYSFPATSTLTDLVVSAGTISGSATDSVNMLMDELCVRNEEYVDFTSVGVPTSAYDDPSAPPAPASFSGSVAVDIDGSMVLGAGMPLLIGGSVDFNVYGGAVAYMLPAVAISGSVDFDIDGEFTIGRNLLSGLLDTEINGSIEVQSKDQIELSGLLGVTVRGGTEITVPAMVSVGRPITFDISGGLTLDKDWSIGLSGLLDVAVNGSVELRERAEIELNDDVDFEINGALILSNGGSCSSSILAFERSIIS